MTGVASWSLLRFEVWGGEGSGGCVGVDSDQFQAFIPYALSLNHTPASPVPLPPASLYILSLHPPITCHPKGVIQAGSLERNGLKREAGLLSVSLSPSRVCVCVCVCVCVLRLNTLFVVCVRLCVRRGGEARGGADGQPLCSLLYCVHIYSLPLSLFVFYLSLFLRFSPQSFLPSCLPLFTHSFSPLFSSSSSLFHPLLSCSRWQRGAAAAAATEQKPECEQEMGRGEGGCGKRRRRKEVGVRHMESLVKGPPQRECVCACGSVMNRGGGEAGYNRCPLRQRFDSNRQRRGETDRQISRQTCRTAAKKDMEMVFFSHSFFCSSTRICCQNFSFRLRLLIRLNFQLFMWGYWHVPASNSNRTQQGITGSNTKTMQIGVM